jgi:hypothetical protein
MLGSRLSRLSLLVVSIFFFLRVVYHSVLSKVNELPNKVWHIARTVAEMHTAL